MKRVYTSRLLFIVALVGGTLAMWSSAMPTQMGNTGNETIGGDSLPCCKYQQVVITLANCNEEWPGWGCSSSIDANLQTTEGVPKAYIIKEKSTSCDGGGYCDALKDLYASDDCE